MDHLPPTDPRLPQAPVSFTGRAGEWFGIWIVNLVLTVVTLGIYSAWAKVRRKRYFYGNTTIGGRAFDYHATGMQILLGRLVVVVALVATSAVSAIFPPAIVLVYLALVPLIPWLLIRATRFNARNSSWSNVRFDFQGRYGDAFVTFILLPIGVALTGYLTLPFLTRRVNRFLVEGHRLGNHGFGFAAPISGFYVAMLVAAVFAIGASVVAGIAVAVPLIAAMGEGGDPTVAMLVPIMSVYVIFFVALVPAAILYRTMVRNYVFAHVVLEGGHRFRSTQHPVRMVWIAVSNAVVVALTLGLMLPWAQIRVARYVARHTHVHPRGSLDDFAGRVQRDRSAIGDAFGDLEGFDIGAAAI